jgi:hypothetical protein
MVFAVPLRQITHDETTLAHLTGADHIKKNKQ